MSVAQVWLTLPDGGAPQQKKGLKLARKRFQTGSVRLRTNRCPAYWEGFYREEVVTEVGKIEWRRKAVNLGPSDEVRSKAAAKQKLAVILAPINEACCQPKKLMTFCGFIDKYRALRLVNKKGTTAHGYETNIRAHYLPEFGGIQLSQISVESVQSFLNRKALEGKSVQTLKNLKWGLSAIFVAAIKFGYVVSNPVRSTELPPQQISEQMRLPTFAQLRLLIESLPEPISTAVWLAAVTCVRPGELAFKWSDLDVQKRVLWIVRAVNRGKLHTPKYHRTNRPIRLTKADVQRLLALKARLSAGNNDWMLPNKRKTGPLLHEGLLSRYIQPMARKLGLPHITWRLLRHWGATQMVEARVPLKAAQERMGHSRPDILLKHYAHVLDESADFAADALSSQLNAEYQA